MAKTPRRGAERKSLKVHNRSVGIRAAVEPARKGLTVKLSRLFLAAFFTLASLPLAAQVNDTYVITAAANQAGNNGTRWQTQFSLFNPQSYDLDISVVLIPTGGAQGIEEIVTVPANSLAYSDNILSDLFGLNSGSGSLLVAAFAEDNAGVPDTVVARAFLVTSNTYNNARSGTYGQTIPGVWTGLLDDGLTSVAQNIRNGAGTGYRTNIGAVNLGRCNVTLRVTVYDADGHTILNQAPFGVPPLGHMQDSLPVTTEAGTVEFYIDDPCSNSANDYAVVFPYTSTIDNLSGDPQYQYPTLLATPGSLFGKVQAQSVAVDPTNVGKKIDSKYAGGVRAAAEHRGFATLTRDAKGWKIAK